MIGRAASAGVFFSVFLNAGAVFAVEDGAVAQQVAPPFFTLPPRFIEIPSETLSCPVVTPTPINLPPRVYDAKQGDCALIGKGEEIEAWLRALEEVAAFCRARQDSSWEELVKAKEKLDREINALPKTVPSGGTRRPGMPEPPEVVQAVPERREGLRYTNWLYSIEENTLNYCRMVDELPKTLAHTCNTIKQNVNSNGGGATDIQKMVYRQWLTRDLNATRSYDFDTATQYYNDILGTDGWDNFRRNFSEDKIRCADGA